jgi:hypothetical protein
MNNTTFSDVQYDIVDDTSARVDIVKDVCEGSHQEPFRDQTLVEVSLQNLGRDAFTLTDFSVSAPGSGVPDKTVTVHSCFVSELTTPGCYFSRCPPVCPLMVPAARCNTANTRLCESDDDCLGATCVPGTLKYRFALFDAQFKAMVRPGTYDVTVTFNVVSDRATQRYALSTRRLARFDNVNNCP